MWLYTIENFYRDPLTLLFGSGRYTFIPLAYRQFGVMMPHNGYLEVLLDSGIVGFTVIIGFFAYVIGYFRRALAYGGRANRPLYFAALVGLSMFMLICLTGPTFYPAVSHVPVWLLIGLVGGVRQREFLKLGASQVGPAMEKIVLAVGPTITPRAQGRKIR
jgi:O-antigen ligase